MITYAADLLKATAALKRWQTRLSLSRTKCRKLRSKIRRIKKHLDAGREKQPRRPPPKPRLDLPVIHAPIPEIT